MHNLITAYKYSISANCKPSKNLILKSLCIYVQFRNARWSVIGTIGQVVQHVQLIFTYFAYILDILNILVLNLFFNTVSRLFEKSTYMYIKPSKKIHNTTTWLALLMLRHTECILIGWDPQPHFQTVQKIIRVFTAQVISCTVWVKTAYYDVLLC